MPVLSSNDTVQIEMVAPYSKLDTVILDSPGVPPSPVFGKEPDHDWYFYFEKVELAIQQEEQDTALSLANEALALDLLPQDPVEWMPFLYTYMLEGDLEMVTTIAMKIKRDEVLEKQVCSVFLEYHRGNPQLTRETIGTLQFLFCHE
jgi:hypothetical protein